MTPPDVRRPFGGLQFGDALVGQPQRGHRAVVVLVEADFAGVEFTDPALHGLELGLGLLRAGGGLLDATVSRADRFVDRLDAGAHGVDLAGQPGQAFAAVGFGAGRGDVRAFGFGRDAFAFGEFGSGGLEPVRDSSSSSSSCRSCAATSSACASSASGSGPDGRLGLGVEVLGALAGDADRRADAFGQRRQPEPRLLGGLGPLAELPRPPPRGRSVRRSSPLAGWPASSCSRRSVVSA